MSEHIGNGYLYFLSERFDDHFKQLASPIKVAFVAGLVVGFGFGLSFYQIRDKSKLAIKAATERVRGSRNVAIEPRNVIFEENRRDILNFLKGVISDAILNRLKASLGLTEPKNIEDLMRVASSGLMTQYREELGIANFFANVAHFLKTVLDIGQDTRDELDKKVNKLTRLCFEKDILLIYADAEEDRTIAAQIKEDVEQWNITVDLNESVGIGRTAFAGLYNDFERYMFIFVIVTQNLREDAMNGFISEAQLGNALHERKCRLVPVKVGEYNNEVFRIITPWRYEATEASRSSLENLIQQASTEKYVFSRPPIRQ